MKLPVADVSFFHVLNSIYCPIVDDMTKKHIAAWRNLVRQDLSRISNFKPMISRIVTNQISQLDHHHESKLNIFEFCTKLSIHIMISVIASESFAHDHVESWSLAFVNLYLTMTSISMTCYGSWPLPINMRAWNLLSFIEHDLKQEIYRRESCSDEIYEDHLNAWSKSPLSKKL